MSVESWWPAVLAVAVWPLVIVVIVVVVVLFVKSEQQPALLSAIAELVRAARGVPPSGTATSGTTTPVRDPAGQRADTVEPLVPEAAAGSPGGG